MPDVSHPDFVDAQNVQTNDQLLCVYMGSLVRAIIALHNLIDNKLALQKAEREKDGEGNAEKKKEEKDKKDTKDAKDAKKSEKDDKEKKKSK